MATNSEFLYTNPMGRSYAIWLDDVAQSNGQFSFVYFTTDYNRNNGIFDGLIGITI